MKRKIVWWILVLAWCVMIFYQSSKPAVLSSEESGFITSLINGFLASILGDGKVVLEDGVIRKTAHFLEYMVLASFLFNAMKNNKNLLKTLIFSIIIALSYSISDEIHQYFVPGRAMRIFDVGVDFAGIITGAGLMFVHNKRNNRYKAG